MSLAGGADKWLVTRPPDSFITRPNAGLAEEGQVNGGLLAISGSRWTLFAFADCPFAWWIFRPRAGCPSQNRIPPVSAAKRKRRPSELIDPSELLALAEIDAEAALAALDALS